MSRTPKQHSNVFSTNLTSQKSRFGSTFGKKNLYRFSRFEDNTSAVNAYSSAELPTPAEPVSQEIA